MDSLRSNFKNFEDVFQFQNSRLRHKHQFRLQEVQATVVLPVPVLRVPFNSFQSGNSLLFVIFCTNEIQFLTYQFTNQNSSRKKGKIKSGKHDRKCGRVKVRLSRSFIYIWRLKPWILYTIACDPNKLWWRRVVSKLLLHFQAWSCLARSLSREEKAAMRTLCSNLVSWR